MRTIIIGAGFAGLSRCRRLKGGFLVLEAGKKPGGLCTTEIKDGFVFDYTGHLMHLRHKETEKFILKNTPVRMNKISRVSKNIFARGLYCLSLPSPAASGFREA
jgi:protoporphyrinogen oxidase